MALTLLILGRVLGAAPQATPEVAALTPALPLRTGSAPMGIAIDPASGRIYVTNSGSNTLSVIDPLTSAVVASVPTGREPNQVVLNATTHRVYVANFADHSLSVIDTTTNTVVRTLAVGGLGLALDATTQRLYATAGTTLSIIDASSDAVVATVPAPAGANLWGAAVDPTTQRVYITDIFFPRVLVFAASGDLVSELAIDAPGRFGILVDPPSNRVHVASYVPKTARVSVIDARTNTLVGSVPVGGLPFSLAVDRGKNLIYVSNLADGTLTASDPGTRSVVATLTAGRQPAGVAFSPLSGRVYVVNAGDATLVTQP